MQARFLTREALNAHDRGWLLVQLDGKKPRLKGWLKMPPPSHEDVERWAAEGNLGVRTGLESGVVVVDVDAHKGGSVEGLDLPTTVTARSGGGGLHYYFRCPEGGLKNSAGKLAEHVDVRGDGGQIVLPGSVHPETGKNYSWERGLSPDEVREPWVWWVSWDGPGRPLARTRRRTRVRARWVGWKVPTKPSKPTVECLACA